MRGVRVVSSLFVKPGEVILVPDAHYDELPIQEPEETDKAYFERVVRSGRVVVIVAAQPQDAEPKAREKA